jgi:formate dehydrogenase iron-sulfur subunit
MNGKSFFVDLSRCTGCRGCQVACKQWKNKPVEPTENTGSHQNPPDLSWRTLKLVRFTETTVDGKFHWLFFPDQCRHCLDAPCKMVGDSEVRDAIAQDPETGAVVFTEKTKGLNAEAVREACPYDIPRFDPATKLMYKCDMCNDRVQAGMLPSCVKTCPTGTMNFGDREDMLALARNRLAAIKPRFPRAELVDADTVRTVYLCAMPPSAYYKYVQFGEAGPRPLSRKAFLAKVLRPLRAFG